jgi:large subunit ribosomal protein L15
LIYTQFGLTVLLNNCKQGVDNFKAKINIEVQWTTESVIAGIEKNGGTITTAYYDRDSLWAVRDAEAFFKRGLPIPKRMIPPEDAIEYYTDPKFRGYLADPDKIAEERLVLAQKYGYVLPDIEKDEDKELLLMRKDPRQIFYGLEPGWVVNLKDKCVLKPKNETLKEYYRE